ncbi:DUF1467 family protein [Litorimonas sp. RW-G-Af-16]|uniref:DUF1467 family protein n=1 Tax=Litorimonas sp. RW-G-Af-16 TaxID=3241168 RepID=UPI00390C5482
MGPFSGLVVFLIIWWTVLFTVLPRNIRGQAEEGEIVEGTEPGAPVEANIKAKFILTTKISVVLWVIACGVIISGVVDWSMFGEFFARR